MSCNDLHPGRLALRGRAGRMFRALGGLLFAMLCVSSLRAGLVAADAPAPDQKPVRPEGVEFAPAAEFAELDETALLQTARGAYRAQDYPQAVRLFQELCRRQPEVGSYRYELGRAQYHTGDYAAAAASFAQARARQFESSHGWLWEGYTAFKLNRWQATADCLGRVDPQDAGPEARLKRAIAWFNLDDPRARAALDELTPADTPVGLAARYYRALTWENAGQPSIAFDLYRELQDRAAPFGPAAATRLHALQPPPWTARLNIAVGYDSRPVRANDDSNLSGAAPDGFTEAGFNLGVRPFYTIGPVTPVIYWLSAFGYQRTYHRNHDLDDTMLGVMQSLENSPERQFNFRVDQLFRRHWLNAKPSFDEWNLSAALQYRRRGAQATQVFSLQLDGILTRSLSDAFDSLQGPGGGVYGSYALIWNPSRNASLTVPVSAGYSVRRADREGDRYRQFSGSIGAQLTLARRWLFAATLDASDRLYRADSSNFDLQRREWPWSLGISLETPWLPWPDGIGASDAAAANAMRRVQASVQVNFLITEQSASQSAYRYTNRQAWLSIYFWY